jgi:rare lipoprotein A
MKYFHWIAAAILLSSFTVAGTFLQPESRPAKLSARPVSKDDTTVALVQQWTSVDNGYAKTGNASYYSNKFHGRRTSSGQVYHKDSLYAAHKSLKFGTVLRVTNMANDSVIYVKVIDRMGRSPHVIDLSYAGAKRLNFLGKGIAKVKIEEVKLTEAPLPSELTEKY